MPTNHHLHELLHPMSTYKGQRKFETSLSQNLAKNMTSRVPWLSHEICLELSDFRCRVGTGLVQLRGAKFQQLHVPKLDIARLVCPLFFSEN